mmetsp:Transcript_12348/g.41147  ORF Transcript_12348/g.41147 Transcript_12348/m.41147 type:complete len:419 (+) Transcript_12348:1238-2494(+)
MVCRSAPYSRWMVAAMSTMRSFLSATTSRFSSILSTQGDMALGSKSSSGTSQYASTNSRSSATTVSSASGSYRICVHTVTSSSVVCSSLAWTARARTSSVAVPSRRKMVTDGVRTVLATFKISLRRGTPSVTFLAETPAKWNVFNVICVAGSPIDCAARTPHISPGCARAVANRDSISPTTQSKAAWLRRCSKQQSLQARVDRIRMAKSMVAFSFSSLPLRGCAFAFSSSLSAFTEKLAPVVTAKTSLAQSAVTPRSATRGSKVATLTRAPHSNCRCAAQMMRSRFTGSCADGSPSVSGSRQAKMVRRASRSRRSVRISSSRRRASEASARHSMARAASRGTTATPSPTSMPSNWIANLASSSSSPQSKAQNFCFSTQAPSTPSSPYKNSTTLPCELRTVPSYFTITDSIDLTRRRCK